NNNNDGLAAARPLTLAFACFQRAFISPSAGTSLGYALKVQMNDGTYNGAPGATQCTIFGNYGSNSHWITQLNGNSVTPTNVVLSGGAGGMNVYVKDLGETQLSNFKTAVAGGIEIGGGQFSVIDVEAGMHWG